MKYLLLHILNTIIIPDFFSVRERSAESQGPQIPVNLVACNVFCDLSHYSNLVLRHGRIKRG